MITAVGFEVAQCELLNISPKDRIQRKDLDAEYPTTSLDDEDALGRIALQSNPHLVVLRREGKLKSRLLRVINLTFSNDPSTSIQVKF